MVDEAPKRSDFPPGDEGHRAYQRSLYYHNKPLWHAARENRRQIDIKYVDKLKVERGCADCGVTHIAVLQLHHVNGLEGKKRNFRSGRQSLDLIMKELNSGRVVILCANCHLIRHYDEQSGFFGQKKAG
jgi:hypothetical protein